MKSKLLKLYYKTLEVRDKIVKQYNKKITIRRKKPIVKIPDIFNDLDKFIDKAKYYWGNYLNLNRASIYRLINRNKKYYDTQVTRLYR